MQQLLDERARLSVLFVVRDPDFRQALVGRDLARHAAQELPLHACGDAGLVQQIHPEGRDRDVGGLANAAHDA